MIWNIGVQTNDILAIVGIMATKSIDGPEIRWAKAIIMI